MRSQKHLLQNPKRKLCNTVRCVMCAALFSLWLRILSLRSERRKLPSSCDFSHWKFACKSSMCSRRLVNEKWVTDRQSHYSQHTFPEFRWTNCIPYLLFRIFWKTHTFWNGQLNLGRMVLMSSVHSTPFSFKRGHTSVADRASKSSQWVMSCVQRCVRNLI